MDNLAFDGPVLLVIMDGVGLRPEAEGNALAFAHAEFLRDAIKNYPSLSILAAGEAVGLTAGQMGNSEVGHNTIGSGQIIKQGIARIDDAFETGEVWRSEAWRDAVFRVRENNSTLHFAGIFSDGGVHSHVSHLEKMIYKACEEGVRRIRVHTIFDGRDVAPQSAEIYLQKLKELFEKYPEVDLKVGSGGGRMTTVADRYGTDWKMVERGWRVMVEGKGENVFRSPIAAVDEFRRRDPEIQDQNLMDFVIVDAEGKPVGKVEKGDALIYFDFRADRAVEIAMAFTYYDFPYFERPGFSPDDIYFVGMTEYNSDTHVPEHRLVPPIEINHTLNEFLGEKGVGQYAISEPSKFGHITYYFNGNSYACAEGEVHKRIDSTETRYNFTPWMKATEITDDLLENLEKYRFLRVNYPNGDMVGHYAELEPGIVAVETVDLQLQRLAKKVDELGGMMLIIADHGNVEQLVDGNGRPMTSHTTNPVPCIFYDNTKNREKYQLKKVPQAGLSNIAATLALLLGFAPDDLPKEWHEPLIELN